MGRQYGDGVGEQGSAARGLQRAANGDKGLQQNDDGPIDGLVYIAHGGLAGHDEGGDGGDKDDGVRHLFKRDGQDGGGENSDGEPTRLFAEIKITVRQRQVAEP